jgi:hypothetical protein
MNGQDVSGQEVRVPGQRLLLVVADDFGLGPATSRGILDLARPGLVTASVLLVNSPHAESSVAAWRQSGALLEMGWHPCLTLDGPVLPPGRVPSLVTPEGRFWPLGTFLRRLLLRRLRAEEIAAELAAQYRRFHDLAGGPPLLVNGHHHIHIFSPVDSILRDLLGRQSPRPCVRRVRQGWRTLVMVPGARLKRALLSVAARRADRLLDAAGFPGNDVLAGVAGPDDVTDADFFARWLRRVPGRVVELACHPGYSDAALIGRDSPAADEQWLRRPREFRLLRQARFHAACRAAGFTLAPPSALCRPALVEESHAGAFTRLLVEVPRSLGATCGDRLDDDLPRRQHLLPDGAAPA